MHMEIKLNKNAELIIKKLNNAGFEAFAVGGCIRDLILNREVTDYDITTNALPLQIKDVFFEYKVIETGIKHGTVSVIIDGESFEITTYRTESAYTDSRHPDSVSFVSDVRDDLSRRDFTVNAIAFSPKEGIIDPYNGIEDIKCKIIRTVGEPEKRFSEDALRILRALRFSSVLGFDIDDETSKSIFELGESVLKVASERILTEFRKMLLGNNSASVVEKYKKVIGNILPLADDIADFYKIPNDFSMRLFYLCRDNISRALEFLRCDNHTKSRCDMLANSKEIPKEYIEKKLYVSLLGRKDSEYVYNFRNALYGEDEKGEILTIINSNECLSVKELKINGNDLLLNGFSGKDIGIVLNSLLVSVIKGQVENQYDELMYFASKYK